MTSTFKILQRVLVYSQGQSAWVQATVNAILCDGSCDVQYDVTGQWKHIPLALQASWMKAVDDDVSPPAPAVPAFSCCYARKAKLNGSLAFASAPLRSVPLELKKAEEEKGNSASDAISYNTETPPLPPPATPPPCTDYKIFQQVLVYSQSHSAWMAAIVNAIHQDGSCDVQYEATRQLKQIPLAMQESLIKAVDARGQSSPCEAHDAESDRELLRAIMSDATQEAHRCASDDVQDHRECFSPPPPPPLYTPADQCIESPLSTSDTWKAGSNFNVSQKVLVHSKGHSSWMQASVTAIHRDGSCDVQYELTGEIKQIPLAMQCSLMKALSADAPAVPPPHGSVIACGKPHFVRGAEGGS